VLVVLVVVVCDGLQSIVVVVVLVVVGPSVVVVVVLVVVVLVVVVVVPSPHVSLNNVHVFPSLDIHSQEPVHLVGYTGDSVVVVVVDSIVS